MFIIAYNVYYKLAAIYHWQCFYCSSVGQITLFLCDVNCGLDFTVLLELELQFSLTLSS